jgi:hypothetical protein
VKCLLHKSTHMKRARNAYAACTSCKFSPLEWHRAIATQRVADGDTTPNPFHREFGRTFCHMDRRVPCGLAATPF